MCFMEVPYTKDEKKHPHDGRYVPITAEAQKVIRMAFNSRLIELDFSASDRALILGHQVQTNETHYSLTDKRRLGMIKERLM